MTNLSDLIERVEAGTSNEPELFWEAFAAVHGPKPERVHGGSKELNDYLAKSNPFFYMLKARAFLDAAMTLVPDGCMWLRLSPATMTVSRPDPNEKRWAKHFEGTGATPALALVAASLRALQEKDIEHG